MNALKCCQINSTFNIHAKQKEIMFPFFPSYHDLTSNGIVLSTVFCYTECICVLIHQTKTFQLSNVLFSVYFCRWMEMASCEWLHPLNSFYLQKSKHFDPLNWDCTFGTWYANRILRNRIWNCIERTMKNDEKQIIEMMASFYFLVRWVNSKCSLCSTTISNKIYEIETKMFKR